MSRPAALALALAAGLALREVVGLAAEHPHVAGLCAVWLLISFAGYRTAREWQATAGRAPEAGDQP